MRAEINDDIPLPYHRAQIVALVNLPNDLQIRMMRGTGKERSPHAAFGTSNNDFNHTRYVVS